MSYFLDADLIPALVILGLLLLSALLVILDIFWR